MPSLYFRNKVLLGKKEAVYGVQETLAAANAVLTRDLKLTPIKGESEELTYDNGGIGIGPMRRTNRFMNASFKVDLAGSGTAGTAPAWGFLLKACGFSETIVAATSATYAFTNTPDSLTLAYANERNKHVGLGARGMSKLDFSPGKHPFGELMMDGIWQPPVDATFPTVDQSAWKTPLPVNFANTTGVSLFGYNVSLAACTFDFGQGVEMIDVPGMNMVDITKRAPTASITILDPGIAAKDFYAIDAAGTLGAFSMVHGVGAGKILTLASPALTQITEIDTVEYKGRTALAMKLRFTDGTNGVSDFTIANT